MNAPGNPRPASVRFGLGLGPVAAIALGLLAPGALAQQAPPPTMEDEVRAFCGNIADAARDQRYLLQKKELEELQSGVDERIRLLDERSVQYRDWLKKREDFMRVAESQLVDIYKNMKADSAAKQLEIVQPAVAAAISRRLPSGIGGWPFPGPPVSGRMRASSSCFSPARSYFFIKR